MDYQYHQQYQHPYQQYDPSQLQLQPYYNYSAAATTTTSSAIQASYYDYNNQQQQFQYYPPLDYSHSYYYTPPTPNPQHAFKPGFGSGSGSGSGGSDPTAISRAAPFRASAGHSALRISQSGQATRKGGSRRGGRLFSRGHRSHSGYHAHIKDGSAPNFHLRGHDQVVGKQLPHTTASTSNSVVPPLEGMAPSMPSSALVTGHAPTQVPAAPFRPPPQMAWCELCRVDCNTLEILEQHKNGKRHKKNMRMQEELQNLNKRLNGMQNVQIPNSEFKPEGVLSEKVVGSTDKETPQDKLSSQPITNEDINGCQQQKDATQLSEPLVADLEQETRRKSRDCFEAGGRGFKRKMRGGRGGKYLRNSEGTRQLAESSKPKEVMSFICELCNIRCESQVVFDSHLAGKKHLSNLKRFHGHQALYGDAGLRALYQSNINAALSSLIPQIHQGVNDPQVVLAQLLNYVLSQAQAPGIIQAEAPGLAATGVSSVAPEVPASAPEAVLRSRQQHCLLTQQSESIPEVPDRYDFPVQAESQEQSVTAAFEGPATGSRDAKDKIEDPAAEGKAISHIHNISGISVPQDSSVMSSLENPATDGEQVPSAVMSEKGVLTPECEVASLDQAIHQAPGNHMEEFQSTALKS